MNEPDFCVRLASSARRDIKRMDPPVRDRILTALNDLRTQPPTGDIKRLAGDPPEVSVLASVHGPPDRPVRDAILRGVLET